MDKVQNKRCPNFPWDYAWGESQVISKAKLPQIIQAVISSLASPESETTINDLVLVGHGLSGDLARFKEMKIKLPSNVLLIDTASFERQLFVSGKRGAMQDPSGKPRSNGSTLSLANMLRSLGIDVRCTMHNSGNDAFLCLLAFQLLFERQKTKVPAPRVPKSRPGLPMGYSGYANLSIASRRPSAVPPIALTPSPPAGFSSNAQSSGFGSSGLSARTPHGYFDVDFSSGGRSPSRSPARVSRRSPSLTSSQSLPRLSAMHSHEINGETRLETQSGGHTPSQVVRMTSLWISQDNS